MPKEEKTPHPRSRKADQLLKKNAQKLRRSESKVVRDKKNHILYKHCLWYHDYVKKVEDELKQQKPNYKNSVQVKKRLDEHEMHAMIEQFLEYRQDKYAKKLEKKRGKVYTSLQLAQMERQDYERGAGLRVPDLMQKDNYLKFLVWDREVNSLAAIKTKMMKSPNAVVTVTHEKKAEDVVPETKTTTTNTTTTATTAAADDGKMVE